MKIKKVAIFGKVEHGVVGADSYRDQAAYLARALSENSGVDAKVVEDVDEALGHFGIESHCVLIFVTIYQISLAKEVQQKYRHRRLRTIILTGKDDFESPLVLPKLIQPSTILDVVLRL